jgi:hypothetical protein
LKLQVCPYVECPILLICLDPTISDFDVSNGFIIVVDDPDEPNCQTSYLVELRCTSTAVTKFSGTFGATKKADKISATILAFSHFVMGHTACTLTFADIQGHYNILAHLFLVAKEGHSGSCKGNPHFRCRYRSPTIPAPSAAGSHARRRRRRSRISHGSETSISGPYLSSLVV